MNIKYWYVLTFFWALIFTVSITYSVPETSWEHEKVVENVDQRFMDLEITDSKLNLVYRNNSDRGVMLKTMGLDNNLVDSVRSAFSSDTWSEQKIVDNQPGSGSYLSAAKVGDELMIAYQDSSIGSEKVVLASQNDTSWTTETVESVPEGGVNVGMYSSLTSYKENPLILYHSPTQGLKAATKQGKEWEKQQIADDMGWFTSTTSCGDEVKAAYRGRNSEQLKISTFEGTWSTRETESEVKSSTSLSNQDCEPHLIYLSESEKITYRNQGTEESITDSAYSRVSLDTTENAVHASYYNYGEGIHYAQKKDDGEWKTRKLTNHSDTDEYNDIAVDPSGNIHLIYAQNSDIIHAQKNTGTVENLREIQQYLQILFGTVLITFLANIARKPEVQNQILQLISKIK